MKKERKIPQAKIVIIGDTGVGKSSITSRYVFDKFDYNQESTLGAAYMQKVCQYEDDKKIKLQIWDTAGQQKYLAIAKLYYRDCRVAVMVYDVTRGHSFENLQRWNQQINKHAPKNVVKMVVGNKIDLVDSGQEEQVSESEGQKFAAQIGAMFMRVSAKDNRKIREIFQSISMEVGPIIEKISHPPSDLKRSVLKHKQVHAKKKCC